MTSIGPMVAIIQQIRSAIDSSGNFSDNDMVRFKIILKRYLLGEIKLDETYYDLLDIELVPMPSRCNMYSSNGSEMNGNVDENSLKSLIRNRLFIVQHPKIRTNDTHATPHEKAHK
jgi:hypothetical protein